MTKRNAYFAARHYARLARYYQTCGYIAETELALNAARVAAFAAIY